MEREAWIIDAVRSPRGKGKETGALHDVHPQRILAQVLNALQERNGFDTADVDDVIMGCGAGSGDHSMDIARMAALDAGWSIKALTFITATAAAAPQEIPQRIPSSRARRRDISIDSSFVTCSALSTMPPSARKKSNPPHRRG